LWGLEAFWQPAACQQIAQAELVSIHKKQKPALKWSTGFFMGDK